jgi:4-amino-4-deoxy-L-arabinose transferase-like glycosyltransferase
MYLFSYELHWLNPIDGFHLFTVLLAAIFLWVLYRFAAPRLGRFAAFLAILFLVTIPRFWADMHFNVKDVPETICFGLVLIAYWTWYEKPSLNKSIVMGILMGCAAGIKGNTIFMIPILLISLFPWSLQLKEVKSLFYQIKSYIGDYVVMAASSIAGYIISWPYLYTDTMTRIKSYWLYIFSQVGRGGSPVWDIGPLREAVTSMPELMLLAGLSGSVLVVLQARKDHSPFWRLLLAWAFVPILSTSLLGAVNFDGIHHFLEFMPAVALMAGYGISRTVAWLLINRATRTRLMRAGVLLLLIANLVQIDLTYYPYLHIYYNELIGGLAGVRDKYGATVASDY